MTVPDRPIAAPQRYRGEGIGLPSAGPGSLSTTGTRLGAYVVDAIAAGVLAALFTPHGSTVAEKLPGLYSLIPFALDYIVGVLVAGRTLGMFLFGLRLIRVDKTEAIGPRRILLRTLLLLLLVPAIVFDRDGRGLHDRLTDSAVVRA